MKKNKQKKSKFKSNIIQHSFTGTMLTQYAGLSPIMNYCNKIRLGQNLDMIFLTPLHNSTKFTNAQILMSIILASLSGINRMKRIAHFTGDPLVMAILASFSQFANVSSSLVNEATPIDIPSDTSFKLKS